MTEHDKRLDPKAAFTIFSPSDEQQWSDFVALWGGTEADTSALRSIVSTVRAGGARDIVVESGFPDLDQASEAEYWSREFALPHTEVYRLHFFASEVDDDRFPLHEQPGYLGYAVVTRPLGRLVRALISPPPCMSLDAGPSAPGDFEQQATCAHCARLLAETAGRGGKIALADETVELFGVDYELSGVPYCGQEAWHLQCGHAVAWTCLFSAHLQARAPRTTLRDAVEAGASARVDPQRAISASGTNMFQLQQIFTERGMPALVYEIDDIETDRRLALDHVRRSSTASARDRAIFGVVCNYLNSDFPVVAASTDHAITVIGWRRSGAEQADIELLFSDADEVFGALPCEAQDISAWKYLMIPLPPNVVLSGESAQAEAYRALDNFEEYVRGSIESMPPEFLNATEEVISDFRAGRLSLRLQLKRRQDYKRAVLAGEPGRGAAVARELSVLRLPEWLWIAEFQDRQAREQGEDCVVAEFVFDTTSPDDAPHPCAVSVGPVNWSNWPYNPRSMPATTIAVCPAGTESAAPRWGSQINGRISREQIFSDVPTANANIPSPA
jgi:hypothetical protein